MKKIQQSKKLSDVCYDIRGPVLEKAKELEEKVNAMDQNIKWLQKKKT